MKDELPEASQVEIHISFDTPGLIWTVPDWVSKQGLKSIIGTPEFVHQVFDKVNELKVAAKSSKKQSKTSKRNSGIKSFATEPPLSWTPQN